MWWRRRGGVNAFWVNCPFKTLQEFPLKGTVQHWGSHTFTTTSYYRVTLRNMTTQEANALNYFLCRNPSAQQPQLESSSGYEAFASGAPPSAAGKKKWRLNAARFYYPVSIYLFIIHYFNSKQFFFFKKFKYLLGTQVKKKTTKNEKKNEKKRNKIETKTKLFAKTKTKNIRLKHQFHI